MQEIELNGESRNITQDNIDKLKQIFPEVFNENKIDFDKLQAVLGENIDTEDEKYRFTWNGKMNALRLSQTPSTGTLRPCKADSVEWDTTQNLYIEGDNLEVLKLLQNSYLNKIKMIYIDPPYNTGNDFVYKDDFKDNIENYKKITGQVDSDGNATSTNKDTDGRYHTNWLNMMYPRLRLARNLLSDDGVIFISIDDNELTNLTKICNEIFSENNYLGCIARATGTTTGQDANKIGSSLDYLLCYRKTEDFSLQGIPLTEDDLSRFTETDEKGAYSCLQLRKTGNADRREDRPLMYYPITDPNGNDVYPIGPTGYESRWRVGKETFKSLLKDNMIVWKNNKDGILTPYVKYYAEGRTKQVSNLWDDIDGNKKGSLELKELLHVKAFDNPKSTALLKKILQISNTQDAIILDFFSGSATTADACMTLNYKEKSNRKYILVQIPEYIDKNSDAYLSGFRTICDIGKSRISAVGEKIKKEIEQRQQLKITNDENKLPDIGFKVFKLDSSNIKKWNPDSKDLEQTLLDQINNYVDGRTEEDVLYEIILKCGLDLTVPVEELNIHGKKVYSVGMGALIVCLDNDITLEVANEIAKIDTVFEDKQNVTVVFKDNGFKDDSVKTNIKETIRGYGIGKFITI